MIEFLLSDISDNLNLKASTIEALNRLGIFCIRDLLFHKPTDLIYKNVAPNLSDIREGEIIQATVTIEKFLASRTGITKIIASNETGSILLVFFHKIPSFIRSKLLINSRHTITGKVQIFDHYYQIIHPEFIWQADLMTPIEPVYPLTYAITNKQLYAYIAQALSLFEQYLKKMQVNLQLHKTKQQSSVLQDKNKLTQQIIDYYSDLLTNLKKLHCYNISSETVVYDNPDYVIHSNLKPLASKELFANQMALLELRAQKRQKNGRKFMLQKNLQQSILQNLGFSLTSSQQEALAEIEHDQQQNIQMLRLLQGDVGCGKTIVALLSAVNVALTGSQTAVMVPTDLLAAQHYQFFKGALENTNISVMLLTGKSSVKDRKIIYQQLISGEVLILVGTHALFQSKVEFKDLAYIIIDEQHKFGVNQRATLINKASNPDILVMTATPIPRSLTLTIFGDMDVSRILHKPASRMAIKTSVMPKTKLPEIIEALRFKLEKQEKVYWICPLVERTSVEEQDIDTYNPLQSVNGFGDKPISEKYKQVIDVQERFLTLQQKYGLAVGILHGKMAGDVKNQAMNNFAGNALDILVATTVIEVGINVPNATLIIIENAEQFGLAQLHQLRGRVGRSDLLSHCILLYDPQRLTEVAKQRLNVMKNSNDGFYIAEQDLLLRGSGELTGTKQSGQPEFFFADIFNNLELLTRINQQCGLMVKDNPMIISSELISNQIKLFTHESSKNKDEVVLTN